MTPQHHGAEGLSLTIQIPWTRDGLRSARDRIDALLATVPTDLAEADSEQLTHEQRDENDRVKANSVWDRLSEATQIYLAGCSRMALGQDGKFTVEDVASDLGWDRPRALALHRNVMRTAAVADPPSWPLMTSARKGSQTILSMSKVIAEEIEDIIGLEMDGGRR